MFIDVSLSLFLHDPEVFLNAADGIIPLDFCLGVHYILMIIVYIMSRFILSNITLKYIPPNKCKKSHLPTLRKDSVHSQIFSSIKLSSS